MTQQQYFHVVAWTRQSAGDPTFLFGDLSETQLKRQFVRPYRTGGILYFRQKILSVGELTAVRIIETTEPMAEVLKAMQERSLKEIEQVNLQANWAYRVPTGYGWDQEDIAYADKDVTSSYVSSRPGSPSLLNQITRDHWLRVVVAWLVLLAVAAWFNV